MENASLFDPSFHELFEFRPRKGDLKKMEIILAAIDCLAELGPEKTTYEAIATRIGTRRAHVAYYFKDKSEIVLAATRYIIANYQQASMEHLQKAKTGEEMLLAYVEGPFLWAIKHPEQLSVMLLFYYFCTVREEYKELHDQIRSGGVERIQFILSSKLQRPINPTQALWLAKAIQNLASGYILDTSTTKGGTLQEAMQEAKKITLSLLASCQMENQV
jgi:AcrR family transcriptional regulator